ncbi:MAG: hypothetical protein HY306_03525 [Nitrosomonadales bacterium]|nr:hypothetical protein [Nitrosomonadales bacterium]
MFWVFCAILTTLLFRAIWEKLLAMHGGPDEIATWAYLQSIIDLISGVGCTGLASGLSVLVAKTHDPMERNGLLVTCLVMALAVALPGLACIFLLLFIAPPALTSSVLYAPALMMLAALVGWMSINVGVLNAFLVGKRSYPHIFWLTLLGGMVTFIIVLLSPADWRLTNLVASQGLAGMVVLGWCVSRLARDGMAIYQPYIRQLRPYILPGLAIGILTPVSLLFIRLVVAQALSVQEVGMMHAAWRSSDWVTALAAGAFSIYWLPRMATANWQPDAFMVLKKSSLYVIVPSAIGLAALAVAGTNILSFLFNRQFVMPSTSFLLFLAGDFVRIISWLFLFHLYAHKSTRAIAIGELLSLPLFALFIWLARSHLSITIIGGLWLTTYIAYAVFNAVVALRLIRKLPMPVLRAI